MLKTAFNFHLRHEDIKITELKDVPLDFDVRKNCLEKEYLYRIEADLGDSLYDPIQQHKLVYSIRAKLDCESMLKAMNLFVGTHNFYNFTTRNPSLIDESFRFIRKINEVYLNEEKVLMDSQKERNIQRISLGFKGPGFLTYQIRYMVNAIREIGEGSSTLENIKEALCVEVGKGTEVARKTAPAKGLFLKNVIFK